MRRKMTKPLCAAFVVTAAMLLVLFTAQVASAAADYTTPKYNIKATIEENHVIHVQEDITVDFGSVEHHGIYRYIPYSEELYAIKHIDAGDWDVSTESESENGSEYIVIRIGDPDYTVHGVQKYRLTYDLKCYRDDSDSKDYLSYDLFPSGWSTAVGSVKSTLTLPKSMDWGGLESYAGAYGNRDSLPEYFSACQIDKTTNTITVTGKNVPAYAGYTIKADLPEGYWVNPANRDIAWTLVWILIFLAPLLTIFLWFRHGRDPQIIKTVEFYPPEGMTPSEIGYVVDGEVDQKDISSMMMYYADKGYLKLNEYARNKFEVTVLKPVDKDEKPFSRYMFESIFRSGDTVRLDNMPDNFGDDLLTTKEKIESYYERKENRVFDASADICRGVGDILLILNTILIIVVTAFGAFSIWSAALGIVPVLLQAAGLALINGAFDKLASRSRGKSILRFFIGAIIEALGIAGAGLFLALLIEGKELMIVAYMLATIVTLFFTMFMRARTKKGAETMGKILGFRDFIRDAEYDKLKALSDEDPEYFFNIMPYAYVMGMDTRWAKKFEQIHLNKPSWFNSYDAGYSVFDALWFGSIMNSYARNIGDSYTDAISIDTSGGGDFGGGGFGGGGFSGGGFGGGGGGAW